MVAVMGRESNIYSQLSSNDFEIRHSSPTLLREFSSFEVLLHGDIFHRILQKGIISTNNCVTFYLTTWQNSLLLTGEFYGKLTTSS